MICVGIDVAKDKHDCFILSSEGEVLADVFTIPNNAEGFETLLHTIRSCTRPNDKMKVGCTGCGYCMPCPKKVDIPGTFAAYNRRFVDGKMAATSEYIMCTLLRKDATSASNCVECGLCEKHCPQHIEIRKELKNARKELEGPLYKVAKKVVPLVIKY